MVRVGFFDRFPMAATKLLSLEVAIFSLDFECFMVGNALSSGESAWTDELEREEGTSLVDLDLDHQDLLWGVMGRVDMTESRKECLGEGE